MSVELEPRVETLEALMADTLRVVRETSLEVDRLSREMRDFKTEMRDFKTEMRNDRREMNKRWGDLAASLGTFVEDIVAPSVPRVLREVFGCTSEAIEFSAVRLKRKHPTLPDRNREFDTVVAGCGYFLTVQSKVKLDADAVNEFVSWLPEVKEYRVQIIMSRSSCPDHHVDALAVFVLLVISALMGAFVCTGQWMQPVQTAQAAALAAEVLAAAEVRAAAAQGWAALEPAVLVRAA